MKKLLVLALMLGSFASYGQLLKVDLTCTGDFSSICDDIESQFQNEINGQDVPEVPVGDFANQMANAVSISTAGTGTDYANLFDVFVLGFHPLAIGADIDMDNIDNAESAGVALSPSLVLGLNLDLLPFDKIGTLEMKDFDLFLSYFSQKNDKMIDQDGTTIGGEISNFAAHIRYRWVAEKSMAGGLFKWNGAQIHTGYRYAKNKLSMAFNLGNVDPVEVDPDGAGPGPSVDLGLSNAITTASIESSSHSIPLEISTSARVLYLFTFFAGAGLDYNIKSSSELDVDASGSVNSTINSGSGSVSGTIVANQGADGEGEATNFRSFFGLQANLLNLKLSATLNKSLSNDTLAANVGVKFAW